MKIIITKYVTAVDDKDHTKGNDVRYSLTKEMGKEGATYNIPNLDKFNLIKTLIEAII